VATSDALLALLVPGPRHGYDLKRGHDSWFSGLRPLAFGQVYATLGRLERDGLVDVAHTESGSGPDRVVYELTSRGRERVDAWLAEPVEPGVQGADELIRKTLAAYHLGRDVAGLVARQRAAHLRRLRALDDATPANGDLGTALPADHVRLHLDADLRWLELAADRLRAAPRVPAAVPAGVPGAPEPDGGNHAAHAPAEEARS
jgi:DNA-binding PadR family transcriptional regulator